MIVEPATLRDPIARLAENRLPSGVAGIEVTPAVTEDGYDFLLVTITLSRPDFEDEVLEQLLEDIEDEVAKRDERYPSVRFQDAA